MAIVVLEPYDFNAERGLQNLADPTFDQDAATKKYVDDEVAGAGGGTSFPEPPTLAFAAAHG